MKKLIKISKFLILAIFISLSVSLFSQENKSLSRPELIKKALEKSYPIANQKAETQKAKYDKYKAYQTYLPNITLNSTYSRLNDNIEMKIPMPPQQDMLKFMSLLSPDNQGLIKTIQMVGLLDKPITLQEKNIFKTDITATMVLFSGFKAPLLAKAASHKENASSSLVSKEETALIKEVTEYYDKLSLIDQSFKVLEESEARLNEETAFAKKGFEVGLATDYDLSKIEVAKQELAAKKISLITKRKLVISKLNQLTDVPKEQLDSIHPVLNAWNIDTTGLRIDKRPEINAMAEAVLAYSFKQKADLSSYLPNVYAFTKQELVKDDLSALDPEWVIGVGLKWTIFDGMNNYRESQKSKIDKQIAQNNLDNAKSLMKLGLEKSEYELEETNALINVAMQKKISSKKGLEISKKQYELGLGSISERLAAETDYQNSQLQLLQNIYDQRVACLNLLEASGNLTIEKIQ